jgi:hypothetical protein
VRDLLLSQRRWGSQRCRKFLAELQIPERKEIGKLTPRQRKALAGHLDTRVPRDLGLVSGESRPARPHEVELIPSQRDIELAPARREILPPAPSEMEFARAHPEMELAPA